MNQLASYTDTEDVLNKRIKELLSPGRASGTNANLYLGDIGGLNTGGRTLVSTRQYPYTALGTIGLQNLTSSCESIVTQSLNRHNVSPSPHSAAQLILLDTDDLDTVLRALRREARHTKFSNASPGAKVLFDSDDADAQWIVEHRDETIQELKSWNAERRIFSHEARSHLSALSNNNQVLCNKVLVWLNYDNTNGWSRFKRNDDKSGTRLQRHFENLAYNLNSDQAITATRGEYAASKILITVYGADFQMKMGKAASGKRPNGIDQIWVRRDMRTGSVLEYLIVEAKGSVGATLGHPSTGQQMSPRWLFWCLIKMVTGDMGYIDVDTNAQLPRKILDALINENIPVRGVIFHSFYGSINEQQVVQMTDLGPYRFANAFANATANTLPFANAPVQQNLFL